jgi:uncharacterized membrane protein YfcA
MEINFIILTLSFFIIALVYSSVGFGGGSSYLALLGQSLFAFSQAEIKATALFCNIMVVTAGTIIFYREGKISWKEIWPYFVASIPMAYAGGFWKLQDQTFFLLLGFTLVAAAFLLWIQPEKYTRNKTSISETKGTKAALGGSVGLLSGLVSIGGGIFLSPILHIFRWMDAKRISALASVFILVNSISGLAGQFQSGVPGLNWNVIIPLLLAVFVGGQIGSRLGAQRFNPVYIKRITAMIILVAAVNIIIKYI